MAERGGHAPHHAKCATISLAKNPGSLVRFTFLLRMKVPVAGLAPALVRF